MWQKTVFHLNRQTIKKQNLLFEERDKLFGNGSVIDRSISIFGINQTVIYHKFKNNADQLLSSWGTPGDRSAYQAILDMYTSSGAIVISNEGTNDPVISLPEHSVSFQKPNTRHILMANHLCDWLRGFRKKYVDYLGRDNYPALRSDFKFVADVTPLEGFTFYYNDQSLEKAITDFIDFNKTRYPFL